MMPILSHRSQVIQPSLHSRSKILVEMDEGYFRTPRMECAHARGSGRDPVCPPCPRSVTDNRTEVFIVQTGAITESLNPCHTDTLLPASQSVYILRVSYYPCVPKHEPEFQWGKMTFPKSPWPLRVELGQELWIFFLAPLASRGALDGGLWLQWGVLSVCHRPCDQGPKWEIPLGVRLAQWEGRIPKAKLQDWGMELWIIRYYLTMNFNLFLWCH